MSPHKALDVYLRGDRIGKLRGNGGAWGMDDDDARQTAASSLEKVAAAAETTPPESLGFLSELIAAQDLLNGGAARRALASKND